MAHDPTGPTPFTAELTSVFPVGTWWGGRYRYHCREHPEWRAVSRDVAHVHIVHNHGIRQTPELLERLESEAMLGAVKVATTLHRALVRAQQDRAGLDALRTARAAAVAEAQCSKCELTGSPFLTHVTCFFCRAWFCHAHATEHFEPEIMRGERLGDLKCSVAAEDIGRKMHVPAADLLAVFGEIRDLHHRAVVAEDALRTARAETAALRTALADAEHFVAKAQSGYSPGQSDISAGLTLRIIREALAKKEAGDGD